MTASTTLDGELLDALDRADSALREVYRKLAEDPDLAAEHDSVLHELHAKRAELSRQVGIAALLQWRASRSAYEVRLAGETGEAPATTPACEQETSGAAAILDAQGAQPAEALSESGPPSVLASSSEPQSIVDAAPPAPAPAAEPPSLPVPPAPASDAQLAAFRSAVQSNGLGATLKGSPLASTPWALTLHELMTVVGSPRSVSDSVALLDELEALDAVGSPERQAHWVRLPRDVQQLWLTMLVARTRALRDRPTSMAVRTKLKEIITRYPAWASKHRPPHVNGLQLRHAPSRGSWAVDAQHCWEELGRRVGDELPPAPAYRNAKKKERRPTEDPAPPTIDEHWPLLAFVQRKSALIVGGDPREASRARLQAYLQLDSLDWRAVDGPRKVEALAQRIAKGAYDLVLVIQPLVAHAQAEPIVDAAKESKTPWAMVESYGASAVVHGIERFLKPAR